MKKFIGFFLISLSASAQQTTPHLEDDKFTVCAITINSDNEKKVWEREMKKHAGKFNPIVELTDFGGTEDWFENACKAGVRCDQILISGHFGGSFFGKSGKSLSTNILENKSCTKSCEGILARPYEVFLFGCNTLSKSSDQTLEGHKARMLRAFQGGSKQIYGFDEKGPSGDTIEPFLKQYFKKKSLFETLKGHAVKRITGEVERANRELAEALRSTAFAQCAGVEEPDEEGKLICAIRDERLQLDFRTGIIFEAFSRENYSKYIPAINSFFKKHPVSGLSSYQRSIFKELFDNKKIRAQVLNKVKGTASYVLASEWLDLAENLNYMTAEEVTQQRDAKLVLLFSRPISTVEKDFICSNPMKRNTPFPAPKRKLTSSDKSALSCLNR